MHREDFSLSEKLISTTVFGSNAAATDIIRPDDRDEGGPDADNI